MREGKVTKYAGVLDIPEGECGDFAIKHVRYDAGYCLPLANNRTMFFGNPERGSVEFPEPTLWHELLENGGRWMSDFPIEQAQHDRELEHMTRGSVLIGGLGLGYAATVLAQRKGITRVFVVEKSREVITLVERAMKVNLGRSAASKVTVLHADLFDYLQDAKANGTHPFHHAFFDIWAPDGEETFHETVVPLLHLSRGLVNQEPVCWNEGVVRGQLLTGIMSNLILAHGGKKLDGCPTMAQLAEEVPSGPFAVYHNWRVPFFRWVMDSHASIDVAQEGALYYAKNYGTWAWPKAWELWERGVVAKS
jgi:hypothetical protein